MTHPKSKAPRYERDGYDWYVEPPWCVDALLAFQEFKGTIWDPFCGQGTIPDRLTESGYSSHGTDIKDRASGRFPVRDFFTTEYTDIDNIVMNPPYKRAAEAVERARELASSYVCVLARLDFLASQTRYKLFTKSPPRRIIILSKRPSMPPGGSGIKARGGLHDYCWIVWHRDGGLHTTTYWWRPE